MLSTCDAFADQSPPTPGTPSSTVPSIHAAGSGGLLFNPGHGAFQLEVQQRLWALKMRLDDSALTGLLESVAGVNNLLVLFDPLIIKQEILHEHLLSMWHSTPTQAIVGQEHIIPVDYGGEYGTDFGHACDYLGLSPEELVARHSANVYTVACIGSMAGFGYLVGLPDALAIPRRKTPRTQTPRGSVMIGGAQTGIQPITAPSGWNILGRTDIALFDPHAESPCLLAPGDQIRFTIRSLTP